MTDPAKPNSLIIVVPEEVEKRLLASIDVAIVELAKLKNKAILERISMPVGSVAHRAQEIRVNYLGNAFSDLSALRKTIEEAKEWK